VACSPGAADAVLEVFRAEGFGSAAVIGDVVEGAPEVVVR
jgi:selenide,water dikinase